MDKTGVFLILAMLILLGYDLLRNKIRLEQARLQLERNKEISEFHYEEYKE